MRSGARAALHLLLGFCWTFVAIAEEAWVSLMPDSAAVARGTLGGDWRIAGGELVGRAEAGEEAWWRAPGTYWNFELEVEFRTRDAAHGGVAYRAHWLPRVSAQGVGAEQMYGYCAAIDARGMGTGRIDDVNGREELVVPAEDTHDALDSTGWNRITVRAKDGVSEVRINGVTASNLFDEAMIGGLVGLRVISMANEAVEIRFRNFRIRDLGRTGAWRELFDGKTLDGWKNWGSEKWEVVEGTFQGRRGPKESEGYLATT